MELHNKKRSEIITVQIMDLTMKNRRFIIEVVGSILCHV